MAKFERSRERKGSPKRNTRDRNDFRSSSPKRGGRTFEDRPSGRDRRDSGRGRSSRNRRDFEMTKVICSSCGDECEVPFKPTSNKPVYCSDCFEKKEKGGSKGPSNRDLDIINEKLNKIMKALKIE